MNLDFQRKSVPVTGRGRGFCPGRAKAFAAGRAPYVAGAVLIMMDGASMRILP